MLRLAAFVLSLLVVGSATAQVNVVAPPSRPNRLVKLARQIEPVLVGKSERLPQYVEFFRSQLANDTRLFAFDVTAAETQPGKVSLEGYVEFPQTRSGLVGFLEVLGFDVTDDQLETLPSASLGDKAFGLVKATHTLSYDQPDEPREVVTDCLLGEPLFLLRKEGDHYLAHSGEGYLGYVSAADVERVDAKSFADYPSTNAVRMITNHTLEDGLVLPMGALLKKLPSDEGTTRVALPGGATADIPSNVCQPANSAPDEVEKAIAVGKQLLGTPYHWGGKTSAGIDCSGLVQVSYAATGLHLPRDSNQQFLSGQLVATRWNRDGLRRGDTLYFLGEYGRIRHTAIYLGDDRFMHAVMPKATINSFNPEHEVYDAKRAASFAFGKRLLQ